jgi:hypothetical protein
MADHKEQLIRLTSEGRVTSSFLAVSVDPP